MNVITTSEAATGAESPPPPWLRSSAWLIGIALFLGRAGDGESGVEAVTVGDDMTHWKGQLKGPEGTPYEGGIFIVRSTHTQTHTY